MSIATKNITKKTINMKQIQHTAYGRTDTFSIQNIEDVSSDYQVWNIGRHNFPFPTYVPMAKCHGYNVDLQSLVAVQVPNEHIALAIIRDAHEKTITANDLKHLKFNH